MAGRLQTSFTILTAAAVAFLLSGCLGAALTGLRGAGAAASVGRLGAGAARGAALRGASTGAAAGFGEAGTMRAGSMALARSNMRGAPRRLPIATDTGKPIGTYELTTSGNQVTLRAPGNRTAGHSSRFGDSFEHFDADNRSIGHSKLKGNRIEHHALDNDGRSHYVGHDVLSSGNRVSHYDETGRFIGETRFPTADRISAEDASAALGLMAATGELDRSTRDDSTGTSNNGADTHIDSYARGEADGNTDAVGRFSEVVREQHPQWCHACSHYHEERQGGECPTSPPLHTICEANHYPDQPCRLIRYSLAPPPPMPSYRVERRREFSAPTSRYYAEPRRSLPPPSRSPYHFERSRQPQVRSREPYYSSSRRMLRTRSERYYSEPARVFRRPPRTNRYIERRHVARPWERQMRRVPRHALCGSYHPGRPCPARHSPSRRRW